MSNRLLGWAVAGALMGCAVRHIPLQPLVEPRLEAGSAHGTGQHVALVMDPLVSDYVREKAFSLTQAERYASGPHFMQSFLVQMRARGITVLEVESERQGVELGASWVLIPDAPGLTVIRPKGWLDFSFLGSLNRVSVSYGVRALKAGAKVPERISGSGSRTASFFWSNALLQSAGLGLLGLAASGVIYGLYYGLVVWQNIQVARSGSNPSPLELLKPPPSQVAVAVLIADLLVSQITAQVFPRLINPLVDLFINEPRWETMVQAAHDDAVVSLANNVVGRVTGSAVKAAP